MKVRISVEYSESLDCWFWEVTVDSRSTFGFKRSCEDALDSARSGVETLIAEAKEREQ